VTPQSWRPRSHALDAALVAAFVAVFTLAALWTLGWSLTN
jgi:hypothetical protein